LGSYFVGNFQHPVRKLGLKKKEDSRAGLLRGQLQLAEHCRRGGAGRAQKDPGEETGLHRFQPDPPDFVRARCFNEQEAGQGDFPLRDERRGVKKTVVRYKEVIAVDCFLDELFLGRGEGRIEVSRLILLKKPSEGQAETRESEVGFRSSPEGSHAGESPRFQLFIYSHSHSSGRLRGGGP
jgi:hypothetical protein